MKCSISPALAGPHDVPKGMRSARQKRTTSAQWLLGAIHHDMAAPDQGSSIKIETLHRPPHDLSGLSEKLGMSCLSNLSNLSSLAGGAGTGT